MDPLTAIGLVGNVLAFLDFSAGLLKSAKEIRESTHGSLDENKSRETVVREMERLSAQIRTPETTDLSSGNASLETLARECHEISIQLLTLLEKIKPKDPDSTGQSILSAFRNKVYDKDREGLEVRLGHCRSQLELQLNHLSRRETRNKLENLVAASKKDEAKLDELHRQITRLRERIDSSSIGPDAQSQLKLFLGAEEKVFQNIAKERILESLSFEGLDRRESMVVETHSDTYAWILEDDKTIETASIADQQRQEQDEESEKMSQYFVEDEEKTRAREKLSSWLAAEDTRDIFHLSGKLGSGKSTLMKFVAGDHQWAAGRKLTIATFYFWNAGSDH
ncbi:hypothetical protein VP1G_10515 [Cytospora mali]|uniref:Nephrocystin 3-like N-terminal domain-containing protein n=1 Tax=Cytospora mali TaxID=578113 RepID=A0A194UNQ9_CYTMA|nr:hypothetical protein VP1G_10515 [Valsa mali var. pyri (nom. inval.)]